MAYLNSNRITMYPSSFREHSQDPSSYLSTEFNLTQLKKLSEDNDLNSYVMEDGEYLCIYLNGYYFKALKSDIVKFGSPLWAYIKLINETIYYREDTSATFESPKLVNLENESAKLDTSTASTSVFKGIAFVTSEPTSGYTYKIQVLDDKGELVESSKMKLKSIEVKDTSGDPITKTFHTGTINDIIIKKETNGFTIEGGDNPKTLTVANSFVIKGALNVNTSLTVGDSINTGDVVIKSSGSSQTTIVGPNDGTISLPSNASVNGDYLFAQSKSNGGIVTQLKEYTDKDTASTIMSRDSNGTTKVKDIYITNQKANDYAVKVDSSGRVIANSLSTYDPTVEGESISFIDSITQSSDGRINATKKTVKSKYNVTVSDRTLLIEKNY